MKKVLIGILIFWAAIFAFLIIPNVIQIVDDDYPRVILQTQPVDPRDFLRGDYVILSYAFSRPQNLEINELPENPFLRLQEEPDENPFLRIEEPDENPFLHLERIQNLENLREKFENILEFSEEGEKVYAILEVNEQNNRAKVIDFQKIRPQKGTKLFLRGIVRGQDWWRGKGLTYGIENYFVPEGKGRELERSRNAENLEVEVAINPKTGKALITDILVSDESFDFGEVERNR